MKRLLFLLLPVFLLGQNVVYNDTLVTKSGEEYIGIITDISDDDVKMTLKGGMEANIDINKVSQISLQGRGIIFREGFGFKEYIGSIEDFLHSRNEDKKEDGSPVVRKRYRPGDHEVLMMPTAYTMEKGQSYITDYELFFLNYNYGITSRTHIGVFMLFPISSEAFETFSLGIKQNYWKSEKVAGALFGTYMPIHNLIVFGNVFSFGNNYNAFHLGIGAASDFSYVEPVYMLGGTINLSKGISLLLEYSNTKELSGDGFNGLLSVGFRFRSGRMAWELGGMRPLEETSDFFMFPWLKGTLMLGTN